MRTFTSASPASGPRLHRPAHGIAPIVGGDVRSENRPTPYHSRPPVRYPAAGRTSSRVEPPPRRARTDCRERRTRDWRSLRRASPHAPAPAASRRVGDIAQEVREGQRVERGIRKRKAFGLADDEAYSVGCARPLDALLPPAKHRVGQVESGDLGRCAPASSSATPAVPVATSRIGGRAPVLDVAHHLVPPAPVLPEGEHLRERVVAARQPVEQLLRELVRRLRASMVGDETTSRGSPRPPRRSSARSRRRTRRSPASIPGTRARTPRRHRGPDARPLPATRPGSRP